LFALALLLSEFPLQDHTGLEIDSEMFISSLQLFSRFHDRFLRDCWYVSRKNWYRGKAVFIFSSLSVIIIFFLKKRNKGSYCSAQTLVLNANWYLIRSEWLLDGNLIEF